MIFRSELGEVIELLLENVGHRFLLVDREGKNVAQDVGFGKTGGFGIDLHFREAGLEHFLGVLAVEDGKIRLKTEQRGVPPQDARGNGMKCAAPQAGKFAAEQIGHATHHFLCRLVGEGQQ